MASADIGRFESVLLDTSSFLLAENRNILVHQFLDHPMGDTHLLFIDIDMGVPWDV